MTPPTNTRTWLESHGLGELADVFEADQITPDVLHTLTAEDLREMGITALGHRKKLLAAVAALKAEEIHEAAKPQAASQSVTPLAQAAVKPSASSAPRKAVSPTPPAAPPAPAPVAAAAAAAAAPPAAAAAAAPESKRKGFSANFLAVSIAVHLILGLGAGYWVVQKIQTKRKLQFTGGPPTVSPSKRALEHKVSLQKKRNAGGAPAQARRIAVTGLAASITLPEMPAMPNASTQFVAGRMAGMGGAGFGSGLGFGSGSGMGTGGMGKGGLGLTMFGTRGGSDGLIGTFYDLKQTPDHKPTDMAAEPAERFDTHSPKSMRYKEVVKRFVKTWNPSTLSGYFRAPGKLAALQLFIPQLLAEEAPKAFQVEKECEGRRWLVHYQGEIIVPHDGKFRFVGSGDDTLVVRCKGSNVLDGSFPDYKVVPEVNQTNKAGPAPVCPLAAGKWLMLRKGEVMKLEVLVGENPGGHFSCFLMIEEHGAAHPDGIYPLFQLGQAEIPKGTAPAQHGSIIFGSRRLGLGSLMK